MLRTVARLWRVDLRMGRPGGGRGSRGRSRPGGDQYKQVAEAVDLGFGEQTLGTHGGQIAEWRVVEPGGIHHTTTGEFIDDFVDESNLRRRVDAIGEEASKQFLGGIAIKTDEERMNNPNP